MAVDIASCEYLGQCEVYPAGSGYNEKTPNYSKSEANAGVNATSAPYTLAIIKFKTPNVPMAISEYLKFGLSVMRYNTPTNLKYALCVSDSNYRSYWNTYGNVTDDNQLATGSFSVNKIGLNYIQFDVETLKPNAVYYLFVWASTSSSGHARFNSTGHVIEIAYMCGAVHIDDGSSFASYQCYIDNGTNWDVYIPYIDNGTSWEMYS